jgi:hypothetical protein
VDKEVLFPTLRAALLRGDIRLTRGFVEFVDIDCLLHRTMIATLSLPQLLLVCELLREWIINLSLALIVGVAPQA